MNNNLVITSLNYYDTNMEKNNKIFNKIDRYVKNIGNKNELERNTIEFYDSDNKVIKKYEYEIIGMYNVETQLWSWAWAIADLQKNLSYKSRTLLEYGLNLTYDSIEMTYLKAELITSRFRITTSVQLDIHVSLASYLTKVENIYKITQKISNDDDENNKTVIYYLFLFDIK